MRLRIQAVDASEDEGGDGDGAGDGGAALRELYRWLRDDEDGPDEVRLATLPADDDAELTESDGAMGPLEVIDVVLTQTVAVANLAVVYAGWRRSRRPRPTGGFTFTRPSDGLTVTVEGGSEEAVRELLAVLAAPPAPISPAPTPPAPASPPLDPAPAPDPDPAPAPGGP